MPPTRNGNDKVSSSTQLGNIKNVFLVALGLAALIYAVAFGFEVYNNAQNFYPSRTFSVTGESTEYVVPDVATFNFTVLTEGGVDLNALQKTNVERANAAITFLKEQGVETKDIKTQNYSVNPRYQYSNCYRDGSDVCQPAEIVGYTISQSVQVKIRDLSKTGSLLDGVVERGANTVSQLSFILDDETAIRNKAREQAISKAKASAEAMAKAGGFRLGRLYTVYENNGSGPYPYYADTARGVGIAKEVSAPALTIEAGSNQITLSVTLTYELY